jgi:hypothetical protein
MQAKVVFPAGKVFENDGRRSQNILLELSDSTQVRVFGAEGTLPEVKKGQMVEVEKKGKSYRIVEGPAIAPKPTETPEQKAARMKAFWGSLIRMRVEIRKEIEAAYAAEGLPLEHMEEITTSTVIQVCKHFNLD